MQWHNMRYILYAGLRGEIFFITPLVVYKYSSTPHSSYLSVLSSSTGRRPSVASKISQRYKNFILNFEKIFLNVHLIFGSENLSIVCSLTYRAPRKKSGRKTRDKRDIAAFFVDCSDFLPLRYRHGNCIYSLRYHRIKI